MASLLISNPVQVVEDRLRSEKLQGRKKLDAFALGYPIPNLRRRTSVAYNKKHSNDVRSLYNGTSNWSFRSGINIAICGTASYGNTSSQGRAGKSKPSSSI